MFDITNYSSPIGNLRLAADRESLVGLWLEGQKYYEYTVKGKTQENDHSAVLEQAKSWLDRYFSGEKPAISDLSLAPIGSGFRLSVWEILCRIPYGQVMTYGEIAKEMAAKLGKSSMSSQAVGNAVGHNPISIIIPCHRVIGFNGSLTGYAGGLDKKIWLLEHEGADMSRLFIPHNRKP